MAKSHEEIDRLYQLPMAEFTPARDALAKQSGVDGAAIKKLQKPNVAAWAVNQLYWRHRDVFDRLAAAGAKLRAAHGQALAGKSGGVEAADTAHRQALRAANERIREILKGPGEALSLATTRAVTETLQALPSPDVAGRLTRPLRPAGFEALAGLLKGAPVPAPRPTLVSAPAKKTPADVRREEKQKEKEIEAARDEVREAAAQAKDAEAVLARAKQAVAKAQQAHERLQQQVEAAGFELRKSIAEVDRQTKATATAVNAREAAEARLRATGSGHEKRQSRFS